MLWQNPLVLHANLPMYLHVLPCTYMYKFLFSLQVFGSTFSKPLPARQGRWVVSEFSQVRILLPHSCLTHYFLHFTFPYAVFPCMQCSRACNGGFKVRSVRCLSMDLIIVGDCRIDERPINYDICNQINCTTMGKSLQAKKKKKQKNMLDSLLSPLQNMTGQFSPKIVFTTSSSLPLEPRALSNTRHLEWTDNTYSSTSLSLTAPGPLLKRKPALSIPRWSST